MATTSPPLPASPTAAAPARIRVSDVSHRYGELEVLRGVSLAVEAGERVALVGPSGCGKSTLLGLIAGLERPAAGTVEAPPAALMPQKDLLLPWRTALDNAGIALENAGTPRRRARERARAMFARFGLERFAGARTWELSGGMRQRVAFVRTLLADTPVLLLDEPFGALDAITRGELQDWLCEALREEPRTTLLVTHDVEEALVVCDRVLVLSARPGTVVLDAAGGYPRDSSELPAARARVLGALR
jgi:NitT/TauT family transport system ATP-binding protein